MHSRKGSFILKSLEKLRLKSIDNPKNFQTVAGTTSDKVYFDHDMAFFSVVLGVVTIIIEY